MSTDRDHSHLTAEHLCTFFTVLLTMIVNFDMICKRFWHAKTEIQEATKEAAEASVLKEKLFKITRNEDITPEYKSGWLCFHLHGFWYFTLLITEPILLQGTDWWQQKGKAVFLCPKVEVQILCHTRVFLHSSAMLLLVFRNLCTEPALFCFEICLQ